MNVYRILAILAITGALLGSIWYSLNSWHYKPLKVCNVTVVHLNTVISDKDTVINNLSTQIQSLMEDNKVIGFQEFFKGYEDENATTFKSPINKLLF